MFGLNAARSIAIKSNRCRRRTLKTLNEEEDDEEKAEESEGKRFSFALRFSFNTPKAANEHCRQRNGLPLVGLCCVRFCNIHFSRYPFLFPLLLVLFGSALVSMLLLFVCSGLVLSEAFGCCALLYNGL